MHAHAKSVLYVRLPCWKIYPGGVAYVADYVHKHAPHVHQEILDLALIPKSQRGSVLADRLLASRPDIVAFSWRNMQAFGPHPEDDALDIVMKYDYSERWLDKVLAARDALSIIGEYATSRVNNIRFVKQARRLLPQSRVVVGGTAVSVFARFIAARCPKDTFVVVGEGEDAMLSLVDGASAPAGDYLYKGKDGEVTRGRRAAPFDLSTSSAVDFSYIASIFPEFTEYLDGYIGVQTKRGCPYACDFCLYNQIEGRAQRYRDPLQVAREIETLRIDYGVRKIWFTDAQFFSTLRSTRYAERVLDQLIERKVGVEWSGFLRLNHLSAPFARKMFASGLGSVDTTFTGSQEVADTMSLGYSVAQQMDALRTLRENGHTIQPVKLYLPLNGPGETGGTLIETIEHIHSLYGLFGREHVLPFIFFVGIQPNTPVEKLLIKKGYLAADYNPLTLNPFQLKRLLYNPPPLGPMIGRAYLRALAALESGSAPLDYVGRLTMDNIEKALRERSLPRDAGVTVGAGAPAAQ